MTPDRTIRPRTRREDVARILATGRRGAVRDAWTDPAVVDAAAYLSSEGWELHLESLGWAGSLYREALRAIDRAGFVQGKVEAPSAGVAGLVVMLAEIQRGRT